MSVTALPPLERARLVPLPERNPCVFYHGSQDDAKYMVPPLVTADGKTIHPMVNGLRLWDAFPMPVALTCDPVEHKMWMLEVEQMTPLWRLRIQLYRHRPTGPHAYTQLIGRTQRRRGLAEIFGDTTGLNALQPLIDLSTAVECSELWAWGVVMICMQFYLLVRDRVLQYEPTAEQPFSEAYPQELFIVYRHYDFAYDKKKAESLLGDFRAKRPAAATLVKLAQQLSLSELVYVVFSLIRQDPRYQHLDIVKQFKYEKACSYHLQRNNELFLGSRRFSEMYISNLLTVFNTAMANEPNPLHSAKALQVSLKAEGVRFYPQHNSLKMRRIHVPAKAVYANRLPNLYAHVWFSSTHAAFITPVVATPGTGPMAFEGMLALAEQVAFLVAQTTRDQLRSGLRTWVEREPVEVTPSSQALAVFSFSATPSHTVAWQRYKAGEYSAVVWEWIDRLRFRYSFFIGSDRLYYFPPLHLITPRRLSAVPTPLEEAYMDESAIVHYTPFRLERIVRTGRVLSLAAITGADKTPDPLCYRIHITQMTPELQYTTIGTEAVVLSDRTRYILQWVLEHCDLVCQQPLPHFYALYVAWSALARREEDVLATLLRLVDGDAQLLLQGLRSSYLEFIQQQQGFIERTATQLLPPAVFTTLDALRADWNGTSPLPVPPDSWYSTIFNSEATTAHLLHALGVRLVSAAVTRSPATRSTAKTLALTHCNSVGVVVTPDTAEALQRYLHVCIRARTCVEPIPALLEPYKVACDDVAPCTFPVFVVRTLLMVVEQLIWWPLVARLERLCPPQQILLPGQTSWADAALVRLPNGLERIQRELCTIVHKVFLGTKADQQSNRMELFEPRLDRQAFTGPERLLMQWVATVVAESPEHAALKQRLEQLSRPTLNHELHTATHPMDATVAWAKVRRDLSFQMNTFTVLTPMHVEAAIHTLVHDPERDYRELSHVIPVFYRLLQALAADSAVVQLCLKKFATDYPDHAVLQAIRRHYPMQSLFVPLLRSTSNGSGSHGNNSNGTVAATTGLFIPPSSKRPRPH